MSSASSSCWSIASRQLQVLAKFVGLHAERAPVVFDRSVRPRHDATVVRTIRSAADERASLRGRRAVGSGSTRCRPHGKVALGRADVLADREVHVVVAEAEVVHSRREPELGETGIDVDVRLAAEVCAASRVGAGAR